MSIQCKIAAASVTMVTAWYTDMFTVSLFMGLMTIWACSED